MTVALRPADVLLVVDMQVDFVTGTLAIAGAPSILPAVNHCIERFRAHGLPVVASRDWHPPDHVSFQARGGPWPEHCVAGSAGAEFVPGLALPSGTQVIDKAATPDREAYSAFEGTRLHALLQRLGAKRLFLCGLATDYCVLNTTRDAVRLGYTVCIVEDAVRAVDVLPGDGEAAMHGMRELGARLLRAEDIGFALTHG